MPIRRYGRTFDAFVFQIDLLRSICPQMLTGAVGGRKRGSKFVKY
jgi:hypothetical protein